MHGLHVTSVHLCASACRASDLSSSRCPCQSESEFWTVFSMGIRIGTKASTRCGDICGVRGTVSETNITTFKADINPSNGNPRKPLRRPIISYSRALRNANLSPRNSQIFLRQTMLLLPCGSVDEKRRTEDNEKTLKRGRMKIEDDILKDIQHHRPHPRI